MIWMLCPADWASSRKRAKALPISSLKFRCSSPLPDDKNGDSVSLKLIFSYCYPNSLRQLCGTSRVRQTRMHLAILCSATLPCGNRHHALAFLLTFLPLLPRKTHGQDACCMLPVCVFLPNARTRALACAITVSEWYECAVQTWVAWSVLCGQTVMAC